MVIGVYGTLCVRLMIAQLASVVAAIAIAGCGRINFDDARVTLVIDHTKVAGDLVDFPVLMSLSDMRFDADVRFVDDTGRVLAHEVEQLTAAGELLAWVKLPLLSASSDIVLYVETGPASDPANVWSNGFTNVYHFGDGVTLDVRDSTGVNASMNTGVGAASGVIHGAAQFPGGAPYIKSDALGVDLAPGAFTTVSYWLEYTGAAGLSAMTFAYTDCGAPCEYAMWMPTIGCFGFNTANDETLGTTLTLNDRWVYVVAVFYNGVPTAGQNALYIDGRPEALTSCSVGTAQPRTAGPPIYWGSYRGYQLVGRLDEARVARGARSPQWIATEYANQIDPTTFVTQR